MLKKQGINAQINSGQDGNIIVECLIKNKYNYCFTIPPDYPFRPPKISINGVSIIDFFNFTNHSAKYKKTLEYVTGTNCLIKNLYIYEQNWSPIITIEKMLQQLETYRKYKYFVSLKILTDKIKEQYLAPSIDLVSWLFDRQIQNT
jgi:hypothetical protein